VKRAKLELHNVEHKQRQREEYLGLRTPHAKKNQNNEHEGQDPTETRPHDWNRAGYLIVQPTKQEVADPIPGNVLPKMRVGRHETNWLTIYGRNFSENNEASTDSEKSKGSWVELSRDYPQDFDEDDDDDQGRSKYNEKREAQNGPVLQQIGQISLADKQLLDLLKVYLQDKLFYHYDNTSTDRTKAEKLKDLDLHLWDTYRFRTLHPTRRHHITFLGEPLQHNDDHEKLNTIYPVLEELPPLPAPTTTPLMVKSKKPKKRHSHSSGHSKAKSKKYDPGSDYDDDDDDDDKGSVSEECHQPKVKDGKTVPHHWLRLLHKHTTKPDEEPLKQTVDWCDPNLKIDPKDLESRAKDLLLQEKHLAICASHTPYLLAHPLTTAWLIKVGIWTLWNTLIMPAVSIVLLARLQATTGRVLKMWNTGSDTTKALYILILAIALLVIIFAAYDASFFWRLKNAHYYHRFVQGTYNLFFNEAHKWWTAKWHTWFSGGFKYAKTNGSAVLGHKSMRAVGSFFCMGSGGGAASFKLFKKTPPATAATATATATASKKARSFVPVMAVMPGTIKLLWCLMVMIGLVVIVGLTIIYIDRRGRRKANCVDAITPNSLEKGKLKFREWRLLQQSRRNDTNKGNFNKCDHGFYKS